MLAFKVTRPKDTVIVLLMKNKIDEVLSNTTWTFVNITKGHICPCKFRSIEDAILDMDRQIKTGKIIKYEEIDIKEVLI
jgi:hypothetical protein